MGASEEGGIMAGKVGPAVPITMMGALFITAMLVALLAPRIWRRGSVGTQLPLLRFQRSRLATVSKYDTQRSLP
jgi:hypothetical protein